MKERQKKILLAIIESYITSAEPVGSKKLMSEYNFNVSSATIRNEMAELEAGDFISQPHTSSGRIPTEIGFRMFIDEMVEESFPEIHNLEKEIEVHLQENKQEEYIRYILGVLTKMSQGVAFMSLPTGKSYLLGISNLLMQPEFRKSSYEASTIIKILEDHDNFLDLLEKLPITNKVNIFLGKENILPEIQSCSIIASKIEQENYKGYIGILGPMRMHYPKNVALIKVIKKSFDL
jgi:transcriptional regulator of heat shock response